MAQSVEQWAIQTSLPCLQLTPIVLLPSLITSKIELTNSQRPETVSVDRWNVPDANLISALFPK